MSNDTEFDVVVIGSGPGGYVAALRASQLGLHTALVEKCETFGGTCLNVGCIPSKALLESSHRYAEIKDGAGRHGIVVGDVRLDVPAMMGRKDKIVKTLTSGVASLLKANQVVTFRGAGSLRSPHEVTIGTDGKPAEVLKSRHVLLATGSTPASLKNLPFDHEVIVDSTDALSFEAVPEKFVVVGGGAVGLELASVWARLGAEVTVVELMDQLLPGCDSQISRLLERVLSRQGVRVMTSSSVESCQRVDGRGQVKVKAPDDSVTELTADKILVAAGRRPYTSGLGLEQVGVVTDQKSGCVRVDQRFRTNVEAVCAIGDVIGGRDHCGQAGTGQLRCHSKRVVYLARSGGRGQDRGAAQARQCRIRRRRLPLQSQRAGIGRRQQRGFRQDSCPQGRRPRSWRTYHRAERIRTHRRGRCSHGIRRQRRGRRPHGSFSSNPVGSRYGSCSCGR